MFGLEFAYEELNWQKTDKIKNLFTNLSVGMSW